MRLWNFRRKGLPIAERVQFNPQPSLFVHWRAISSLLPIVPYLNSSNFELEDTDISIVKNVFLSTIKGWVSAVTKHSLKQDFDCDCWRK